MWFIKEVVWLFLIIFAATAQLTTNTGTDVIFKINLPESIRNEKWLNIAFEKQSFLIFDINIESQMIDNIRKRYKSRVSTTKTTPEESINFVLRSVTKEDAGRYLCVNDHNEAISKCGELLIVTGKPSKPVLTAEHEEKTVSVSCSSNSTSLPVNHSLNMSVIWRRNTQLIGSDSNMELEGSRLRIIDIHKEKGGTKYSCRASEVEGLTSDWSDPQYGPDSIRLDPEENLINVDEGSPLTVRCTSDCKPACKAMLWKERESSRHNTSLLDWARSSRRIAGTYICNVSNIYGRQSRTITINVMYAPSITSFTMNGRKELTVREGDAVRFECVGDGNPSPYVYFDLDTLLKPTTFDVTTPGFNSSHEFSSIQCSQHGWYRCLASNSVKNTTSYSVDLKVKCGPKLNEEGINNSPGASTFSIWAYPEPNMTDLYFAGDILTAKRIPVSSKYRVQHSRIRENLHRYTFKLENFDDDDVGTYLFTFTNAEATRNISVKLTKSEDLSEADGFPVSVILAAICSVLIVVAVVAAPLYIHRYKKLKEQRRQRSAAYLTPVTYRHSGLSDDPGYAAINVEDVSVNSVTEMRNDYTHLQGRQNHIYTALYPRVEPVHVRPRRCNIVCGCLSVQCTAAP